MRVIAGLVAGVFLLGCRPQGQDFKAWSSPRAESLREAMAEDPRDAKAFYWRGYAASHINDVATVRESYRRAIQLDPKNEWYQISYGWALFNAGAFAEARDQWLRAEAFCRGEHPQNEITVALGFYGVGDFAKAAERYDRQVKRDRAFATFAGLEEATAHWTWREKVAVYDLFDIWRYSYRR